MVPGGNILLNKMQSLFELKQIAFNMMDAIYTKCFFAQAQIVLEAAYTLYVY